MNPNLLESNEWETRHRWSI